MFSEAVRRHRWRVGLTQEELACRTGISSRTIGKIEAGRIDVPRPATVRLLADAFGLTGAEREHFSQIAGGPARQPPRTGVPAQLPPDVPAFTGREGHLASLDAQLDATTDQSTAVIITAIAGTAGVGKTALAVHWGHRVADRFPDGQLYVNLRGFHPAGQMLGPADAVRGFLDALHVDPRRLPPTMDAQTALYRSLLTGRRMFILLDNARDSDQIRHLLPATPGCLVVITSRKQLTGLIAAHAAHPLTVDLLTQDEATQFLSRRIGTRRVAVEPEAANEIITACARLPLALAIAAARAATHPRAPLATVASDLRSVRHRLDALTSDDPTIDVRAVMSWSYQALTPPASRLFRLLGLHPGPDISTASAASLAALPPVEIRPVLAELTHANLIAEHDPGRYAFHDLLRIYAIHLTHILDPDDERHSATGRVLDHYLHTAHAGALLLDPHRTSVPDLTSSCITPEPLIDYEQAMAWFTAEHRVLLAAIDHASTGGWDIHTWQLAWTLADFLERRGHWHDWAAVGHTAVAAARRSADPKDQATACRLLANAYTRLARYDDATTHLQQALQLLQQTGERQGQAHTHLALALLSERQSEYAEALKHARHALSLFGGEGCKIGQAAALNAVGWCHAHLDDHHLAINHCRQALALHNELGDAHGVAYTWDSLGYAHSQAGQHIEAITCYQEALRAHRDLGDRYYEAEILTHIGDAHHATSDAEAARHSWQQALTILDDLEHPDAEHLRTILDASRPSTSQGS